MFSSKRAQSASAFFSNLARTSASSCWRAALEPVSAVSAASEWSTRFAPHLHSPNSPAVRSGSYLTHSTFVFCVNFDRIDSESRRIAPCACPAAAFFASASGECSAFGRPHVHSPKLALS
eukprot:678654-Prymnesium_polylepis.1